MTTQLIAARIAQPDMQGLGAEAIVSRLNAPDPSLPTVTDLRSTRIGPGTIMGALGATEGATVLDALSALAQQSRPVHWALSIIMRGELDVSVPHARTQIDQLAAAGVMTTSQAATVKALAEVTRHKTWAEHNSVAVDLAAVRLAMASTAPTIWLPAGTPVRGTIYVVAADGSHKPSDLVGCAEAPGGHAIVQFTAADIAAGVSQ